MEALKTMPFQVNNRIVELVNADNALRRQLKEQKEASKKALWDAVHEEYPELDMDENFSLKCEFAEQGVVMLDVYEDCTNPRHVMARALGKMLKDVN